MNDTTIIQARPRGAATLLILVGAWGAVVAFAGPSFGYSMGSGGAWTWTESHATLHLAPGLATVLGALLALSGRRRGIVLAGLWLALLGGVWFVLGPSLHPLWAGTQTSGMGAGTAPGMSMGHTIGMGGGGSSSATSEALSAIGYHYGTGAVIIIVAAWTLGALSATRRVGGGVGGIEDARSVDVTAHDRPMSRTAS